MSIEDRILSLEVSFGVSASNASVKKDVVETRVQSLLDSTRALSSKDHNLNMDKCNALARELDPSGLLLATNVASGSHSNTVPYIFRRQEILARSQELKRCLEQLGEIRNLLLISNPSLAKQLNDNNNNKLSIEHVVSAPIVSSPSFSFASDSVIKQRLDCVTSTMLAMNERVEILTQKSESFIEQYYKIMAAVSEKMVLLEESLNILEGESKDQINV